MEYEFTDEQWQKIKAYLPKRKTGRPYKNLCATVNGIYRVKKTGATCRTLPPGSLKDNRRIRYDRLDNFSL